MQRRAITAILFVGVLACFVLWLYWVTIRQASWVDATHFPQQADAIKRAFGLPVPNNAKARFLDARHTKVSFVFRPSSEQRQLVAKKSRNCHDWSGLQQMVAADSDDISKYLLPDNVSRDGLFFDSCSDEHFSIAIGLTSDEHLLFVVTTR